MGQTPLINSPKPEGFILLKRTFPQGMNHSALVASDFHFTAAKCNPEIAWKRMEDAVKEKKCNELIINGDWVDSNYLRGDQEGIENSLSYLRDNVAYLMTKNPELRVTLIIGNHDRIQPCYDAFNALKKDFPLQFDYGDALIMGDSLFYHGDLTEYKRGVSQHHLPIPLDDFPKGSINPNATPASFREQYLKNQNANPVENFIAMVDKDLHHWLGKNMAPVKKVFFGHKHLVDIPKQPIHAHGKDYFYTGCAQKEMDNSIQTVTFHPDGHSSVKSHIITAEEQTPYPFIRNAEIEKSAVKTPRTR